MNRSKSILWVPLISLLFACNPTIERLTPNMGNVGDVIDIRDPANDSFQTAGTVYFGSLEAANVLSWTPEDIYVEVPPGLSGSVPVQVVMGALMTNAMDFLVLDNVELLKIMCFGDSMFHGGVPEEVQILVDQDPDMSELNPVVMNQGRGAEHVVTAWFRWMNALNYYNYLDLVVLLQGANDVADEAALPMEQIQQSVMNMIDEALLRGIDLAVCSLLPRVGSCGDVASPTTESFNDWLASYADGLNIPFVDIYEDFVSTPNWEETYFYADDCLHPNATGRQRIAELIKDKLRELFVPTCTDLDEDGYGNPASPICLYPELDCDDTNPDVYPGATEICDGQDNDCDIAIPADEIDDDGDQYVECAPWVGTDPGILGGDDCNDENPDVNPGQTEGPVGDPTCGDGLDNDCDLAVDEADTGCQ